MTPVEPPSVYRFDRYTLDPQDRRLTRDGATIDLNSRYLDALILLVAEAGRLVSKDRFMAEVWKGVPVTDEALTQCVRSLRRALGDEAARPRFIETAPKHGYRFIAGVDRVEAAEAGSSGSGTARRWRRARVIAAAGMIGGGGAGLVGGLLYGLIGASLSTGAGPGSASVVVLAGLTLWVGLVGGAGVASGVAAASLWRSPAGAGSVLGGALGGLLIGGMVKLIGADAFALLLGRTPGPITGGAEGFVLGGAVGLGLWAARPDDAPLRVRRAATAGGLFGAAAGLVIAATGGRLMAGSLLELALRFPDARLRMDALGGLFGETGLGPITRAVTAAAEAGLFAACVVGCMALALRSLDRAR